ncbi:MAG: hypothetical protein MCS20_01895 [Candidatus Phytoplasma mali]|nr:hypothetical protein [Candidatus Karelsulcia muelleri]MCG7202142.1 hypothetical protein [Candidatus Phytoplasma mali]
MCKTTSQLVCLLIVLIVFHKFIYIYIYIYIYKFNITKVELLFIGQNILI